ncbi:MAG: hypothetical protein AAF250_04440 [Pseudomonadota bacterium]
MKRLATTATFTLGLALTACNNTPDTSEDIPDDDVETISLDEVPDAGDVEDDEGSTTSAVAGGQSAAGRTSSAAAQPSAGSKLIKGGSDTAGSKPPAGSKLQRADPEY